MDGKEKVSNFTKLPLMSFLESSRAKFDTATEKIFILQLKRERVRQRTKREREW